MINSPIELPKYQCHKQVYALKIVKIETKTNPLEGIIITPEEPYKPFEIDNKYSEKHKPQAGGYFVVYEDGYTSYSPAQAFEEGYTLIREENEKN